MLSIFNQTKEKTIHLSYIKMTSDMTQFGIQNNFICIYNIFMIYNMFHISVVKFN